MKELSFFHFFSLYRSRASEDRRAKLEPNMASSEGEQKPQEQQRAPGLPRAEFIDDVGKFLEGEKKEMR